MCFNRLRPPDHPRAARHAIHSARSVVYLSRIDVTACSQVLAPTRSSPRPAKECKSYLVDTACESRPTQFLYPSALFDPFEFRQHSESLLRAQEPSTCAPCSPTLSCRPRLIHTFPPPYAMKRRRTISDGHPGPPQQSSSPWRWNIGGPILDFGDEDAEAGPSTRPCVCDDCVARPRSGYASFFPSPSTTRRRSTRVVQNGKQEDDVGARSNALDAAPATTTSRRRLRRQRGNSPRSSGLLRPLTTALALSLATVPLAAAGPVPLPHRTRSVTAATDSATSPTRTLAVTTIPPPLSTQTGDSLERRRLASVSLFESPSLVPSGTLATLSAEALPYVYTQSSDGGWYKDKRPWWIYGVVMVSNS